MCLCVTAGSTVLKVGYHNQIKLQKLSFTGPDYFMVDIGDSVHSWTRKQRSPVIDFEEEGKAIQDHIEVRIPRIIILKCWIIDKIPANCFKLPVRHRRLDR